MKRRISRILLTFGLVASGLTALTAAPVAEAADIPLVPYCSTMPAPCIESLTRDGVPVSEIVYRILWDEEAPGSGFYSWHFEKYLAGSWTAEMGGDEASHIFAVTFDFGSFNPRIFEGRGKPADTSPVQRSGSTGDYHIAIAAKPIYRLAGCSTPLDESSPTCPFTASPSADISGWLSGVVNNAQWFGVEEAEHEKIAGFYNFRNADLGEGPPVLETDPVTGASTMVFTLQNAHENSAHEIFKGFQHLRLPNQMLREVYGIPDPGTMTSSSLATSISGGVGSVFMSPEPGHGAMIIDITDVTFSKRTVTVRLGTIVPTRPTALKAKRLSRTKVKIDFAPARARGARPTGYLTRCVWKKSVRTAKTKYSIVTVKRLKPGKRYTCRVRAMSKAGSGPWSASIRR